MMLFYFFYKYFYQEFFIHVIRIYLNTPRFLLFVKYKNVTGNVL